MTTTPSFDEQNNLIPISIVYEKMGEYFNRKEIRETLMTVYQILRMEDETFYSLEDFINICHELELTSKEASFCAGLLIIEAISIKQQQTNYFLERNE